MTKKRPPYNQNAQIRGALRRAFARSPLVQEKMAESRRTIPRYKKDGTRAKKDWVQRQCETCLEWVSSTKISVDHREPVVSVDDGFVDWNDFIERLWCAKSNLNRLCDTCHGVKTNIERITRLRKKYTKELNDWTVAIDYMYQKKNTWTPKELTKILNKYIAKKKTPGLEDIVQRAIDLKNRLNNKE